MYKRQFLYDCGHCIVVGVAGLSCLEEDIRVLSGTSLAGMVRVQSMFTECINSIHIYHVLQILVIPGLDLLDLVRCTESIEEVDEGDTACLLYTSIPVVHAYPHFRKCRYRC